MSEDKVVSIHGGDRTVAEANAEMVEGIEEILTQVKAGLVTGIALVAATSDGGIVTGIHRGVNSNAFALLGGITHLFHRADKDLLG